MDVDSLKVPDVLVLRTIEVDGEEEYQVFCSANRWV